MFEWLKRLASRYYTITIKPPTGQGSTSPRTGSYSVGRGRNFTVMATPAKGWHFDHWVIDGKVVKGTEKRD